jgi:hypothetical protein
MERIDSFDFTPVLASVRPAENTGIFSGTEHRASSEDPCVLYSLGLGIEANESMISYGTTNDSEASPTKTSTDTAEGYLNFQAFGIDLTKSVTEVNASEEISERPPEQQNYSSAELPPQRSPGVEQTGSILSYDTEGMSEQGQKMSRGSDSW